MGRIKLKNFMIACDRQQPVYRPGEIISGNCVINLKGELDLKQLDIRLYGCSKTEWNGKVGDETTKSYCSKYTIIDKTYFLGSGEQSLKLINCHRSEICKIFKLPRFINFSFNFLNDLHKILLNKKSETN
jgi:hypothetical protein